MQPRTLPGLNVLGVIEECAICIIDLGSCSLVCLDVSGVCATVLKICLLPVLTISADALLRQGEEYLKSLKSYFMQVRLSALPAEYKCEQRFFILIS